MRKFIRIIFVTLLALSVVDNAFAVGDGEDCAISGGVSNCNINLYCYESPQDLDLQVCMSCDQSTSSNATAPWNGTHPSSVVGSVGIASCYKTCGPLSGSPNFPNGTRDADNTNGRAYFGATNPLIGPDCTYNNPANITSCSSGYYKDVPVSPLTGPGTCEQCPSTHPESISGQNYNLLGESECYVSCLPLNGTTTPIFANGTWAPDATTVKYGTGFNNTCGYTTPTNVTCNNSSGANGAGFHLNYYDSEETSVYNQLGTYANWACISNTKNDCKVYDTDGTTVAGTGEKYWNATQWDDNSGNCYNLICTLPGYHKETVGGIEKCLSDTKLCSAAGLSGANGKSVQGNAVWDGTTYSLTGCYIEEDYSSTNGSGVQQCNWIGTLGGVEQYGNCQSPKITRCDPGYYLANPTDADCVEVGAGHYSQAPNTYRNDCSAGKTTPCMNSSCSPQAYNTTASSETECYYVGGSNTDCAAGSTGGGKDCTRFCDTGVPQKCFYLPADWFN